MLSVVIGRRVARAGAGRRSDPKAAAKTAKTWTPPRTPDGQPDLQGMWTNATITPFRAARARWPDKPFLTEQEAAVLEQQAAERRATADDAPKPGDVGSYNDVWFDAGTKVVATRQTSLVIDPPDGRVPLKPLRRGGAGSQPDERRLLRVDEPVGSLHHAAVPAGCFPPATTTPTRFCRRRDTW